MDLSGKNILHLAKLARLQLSPEEIEAYRQHLSDILRYVEQLQELDLTGVEPTTHGGADAGAWRPDEVEQRLEPDAVERLAPEHAEQQVRVPKVVGE